MKTKTPLALAIEKLEEATIEYPISINRMKRILTELLPKEKEVIENAFDKGYENGADAYLEESIYHGSNYFKKQFTQEQ